MSFNPDLNINKVKLYFPGYDKIISPKYQLQHVFCLNFNKYNQELEEKWDFCCHDNEKMPKSM